MVRQHGAGRRLPSVDELYAYGMFGIAHALGHEPELAAAAAGFGVAYQPLASGAWGDAGRMSSALLAFAAHHQLPPEGIEAVALRQAGLVGLERAITAAGGIDALLPIAAHAATQ